MKLLFKGLRISTRSTYKLKLRIWKIKSVHYNLQHGAWEISFTYRLQLSPPLWTFFRISKAVDTD